ncbi:restriction endonuclease [Bacillus arachidis]|uniref:Restriction endonuclease n=1 Tax=Bacillus arachidis TaxID=2819290 RepID=A0ABS3P4X7_9BACI|nr:restriction endonuclease [Bacillus arachidis]MBO1628242.1 restriction endonuclease [Bacillus arachidis]
MNSIKKYETYDKTTKCTVDGCENRADYEVYLYDYYDFMNEEFLEQDYTCPFICEEHMQVNESSARGERKPRGIVHYPYTNKGGAQGYTRYQPVLEVYSHIFHEGLSVTSPSLRVDFTDVNSQLIQYLARNPELMYQLEPRKFEELVAELFHKKGYEVELTPRTRDGGKDIYALKKDSISSTLFLVEAKRYSKTNKVGVELVRGLYGVKHAERANVGMLVTTSSFTKDAIEFASPLKYEMSLKDFSNLEEWLKEYK